MGTAFGRMVVDRVVVGDPYMDGLDDLDVFEVISDAGPRYRVRRLRDRLPPEWRVFCIDTSPSSRVGRIVLMGSWLNHHYALTWEGHRFSSDTQHVLANAVFRLIGEIEDDRVDPFHPLAE